VARALWRDDVRDGSSDAPGRACAFGGGAGVRVAVRPRAHPYPGEPAHPAAVGRRRPSRLLQAGVRPVRRDGDGGGCDRAAPRGNVHLSPSWSWPKPTQKPWPPVLLGGAAGSTLFAHVAEYADGWIPIGGAGVREALPQLHRAVEAAGRDSATVRVIPFGTIPDPGKLEYYASIGIDEVVLRVPAGDREAVVPVLDDYSKLVEA